MMTKTTIRSTTKVKPLPILTVSKATTQARRIVDKVMPGVMATVDSRGSWDLDADVQVVITMITFPQNAHAAQLLSIQLLKLGGKQRVADSSIVITRPVK